jgi:ribosomal protein S12 methylthiotransferase
MKKPPAFHVISLGCPKNQIDSERFLAAAVESGYRIVDTPEEAGVILINTCGFIADAKQEGIETILDTLQVPGRRVLVSGCLVQRYANDLTAEIPEVDAWIPLKDVNALRRVLRSYHPDSPEGERAPRVLLNPKHYAYLRIGDGCNNRCAYCAIPDIRGPLHSDPADELVAEAEWLADQGVRELIVTAQDITRWGEDLPGKPSLSRLLERLHDIHGLDWIRLLYLHPAGITAELLDTIAGLPKVLRYFDIPLQHADDRVLSAMRRRIDGVTTRRILDDIRTRFPGCVLRTSLITGFPGEDRAAFNTLLRFVEEMRFERLGVFAYSPEEGTPAFDFPNRPTPRTASRRRDEIMTLQSEISASWLETLVGSDIPVIVDEQGTEFPFEGRAWFDAPEIDGTVFIQTQDVNVGEITTLNVTEAWEYDLVANRPRKDR